MGTDEWTLSGRRGHDWWVSWAGLLSSCALWWPEQGASTAAPQASQWIRQGRLRDKEKERVEKGKSGRRKKGGIRGRKWWVIFCYNLCFFRKPFVYSSWENHYYLLNMNWLTIITQVSPPSFSLFSPTFPHLLFFPLLCCHSSSLLQVQATGLPRRGSSFVALGGSIANSSTCCRAQ